MGFPLPADELVLHERVLACEPLAPVDIFQRFMDPLTEALRRDLRCTEDEAYDSGVDAILTYLEAAGSYDRNRGRLCSYLMDIAKKRAVDRLRSRTMAERRDDAYGVTVELCRSNPKDTMEVEIEARELWQRVEVAVPNERDRHFLKLILAGERSTGVLAEALDISGLSSLEQRRQVKQHRDRLLKVLKRLGSRLGHDKDA